MTGAEFKWLFDESIRGSALLAVFVEWGPVVVLLLEVCSPVVPVDGTPLEVVLEPTPCDPDVVVLVGDVVVAASFSLCLSLWRILLTMPMVAVM